MILLRQILHPTDFSDNSDQALKYACSLAVQFSADLHLIHVVHDTGLTAPAGFLPPDYYEQRRQSADEELAALSDKALNYTGNVIRSVCEGQPFVEIIRYAKENEIDMIIMGTHEYLGLKHLIMGSVAENVVRKAHCPVLTVRPEKHDFEMP